VVVESPTSLGERFGLDTLVEARMVREHYAEELTEHAVVVH
jgi:hypothetical protein